jgi:hypothetical protein
LDQVVHCQTVKVGNVVDQFFASQVFGGLLTQAGDVESFP